MWPVVLLCVFGIVYFIQFVRRRTQYFSDRGIPGPKPTLFVGNAQDLFLNSAPLKLQEWTGIYGKNYGVYEGATPVLVTSDLDIIHDVFVKKWTNFHGRKMYPRPQPFPMEPDPDTFEKMHVFLARGVRWKRLRSITNPAFAVAKLKMVIPSIFGRMEVLDCRLHEKAVNDVPFDVYPYFQEFTLDVIARIAFGEQRSLQEMAADDNPYLKLAREAFQMPESKMLLALAFTSLILPELNPIVGYLADKVNKDPTLLLEQKLSKIVDERRANKDKFDGPIDYIQLFLEAEASEEETKEMHSLASQSTFSSKQMIDIRKRLTLNEMSMNLMLFLLAGYDTTSNTLAYATHLLAMNPQIQQTAVDEIHNVFGDTVHEDDLTYENIQKLVYLDLIIKETLRMYPHASIASTRECSATCQVGNITLDKGVSVWPDVFTIHYDKTIWGDDAHLFRPERFAEKVQRHPMAWLPFGAGPRMCQGMRLALIEVKMVLATLFANYEFTPCDKTQNPLKIGGVATIAPEHVTLAVKIRN